MLNPFRRRRSQEDFRTRSAVRDADIDRQRLDSIGLVLNKVLDDIQAELDGLVSRFDDAQARASLGAGTDAAEYLDREPNKSIGVTKFENQMRQARQRISILEKQITDLRFVRAAFLTRFGSLPVLPPSS